MELGTISGIATAVLMIAFVGVVVWAYSSKRKADFDAAAQLPLGDRDEKLQDEKLRDENRP
jgi:cytochrome c oxidase cbb3-type subunit 4